MNILIQLLRRLLAILGGGRQTMGYRAVTKKVNRKTLPQGHKPIDGFNAALDAAVKEYGSQFPTIGDRGDVRVELSATVQRDNPGAYDDYIVTLSPI